MSEGEHYHQERDLLSHDEVGSAPPHNDNGYIVVPPTPQSSVDLSHKVNDTLSKENQEEISKMLVDISSSVNESASKKPVVAEADSSSSASKSRKETTAAAPATASSSSVASYLCPYYLLACNFATKWQLPPQVKDLLLWTNPKLTGAVFGSSFVLLLSLALFSLLTVISSLLLLALTVVGSYRFYLAVMFRIKGVNDQTFEKLSELDVSLPKDKVKQLANLLETDINRVLNQVKSIVLWDNVVTSSLAVVVLYIVYSIGTVFNTLTLLILTLVSVFTLPKVYQVYQKPIDQAVQKATDSVHAVVKQALAKVPFLNNKKKVQ